MRDLPWFAYHRAHHGADRDTAVIAQTDKSGVRQPSFGRIGDHAKGGKGQIMGSGDACRDMGFHIHGDRPGRYMERPLMRRIGDRGVDARYVDDQRTA